MLPSGSPVSNLGSQPWTAFAAGSGQPTVPGAQTLSVDRLIPGVMGPLPQAYNRSTQSVNHVSSIFPGSSMHSGNGAYAPHVPMAYAMHPTAEHVAPNDRTFSNAALTQSYSMQPCCSIPQTSLPYGQSMPYFTSSLLPSLCNGFLNNVPQPVAAVQPHPQAALAAAAVAATNAARNCDSLRHFGPTLVHQISRRQRPSVTSKTNLYISGLLETDSDETLRMIVESVVQPKSCKAMTMNGICKGYGFIDCETEKEAELAMERINEFSRTTGRKLSVKFAFENEKDKLNVFVQHLPRSDYTTEDLMELFKPYGIITSAKLLDSMKGPTGIGFVRFSHPNEADKAIRMMNKKNLLLGENTKAVTCKLADKADAQRRTMVTSDAAKNKFSLSQGHNQSSCSMIPTLHTNSLPAGHLSALAQQSGSLPGHVLPALSTFSFEVPGFPNHAAAPLPNNAMASGMIPNMVSGSSALVQLPFPAAHAGAMNAQCPSLSHRTNNPLIGPPPHTQIPATVQSPQYMANLVSAYLSSMDMQQGTLKAVPAAMPPARFPNAAAPSVMFHAGNALPTPGGQSDGQFNSFPSNVQYALSYGQQPPQTMASGGTTAISPQVVWLAPTYPNSATSSMFHNYAISPASFQPSVVDQTKGSHESQRSTPGLPPQNAYATDRTTIPTGVTSMLNTMFQNLSMNGPPEVPRFSAENAIPNESHRTWAYTKAPKPITSEEQPSNIDQALAGIQQTLAGSLSFDVSDNPSFVDSVACEGGDFTTPSMAGSHTPVDHTKHTPTTVCFGSIKSTAVDGYTRSEDSKLPEVDVCVDERTLFSNDNTVSFSAVNGGAGGDGVSPKAKNPASNGFESDRKKARKVCDSKTAHLTADSDSVDVDTVTKSDAELVEQFTGSATTGELVKTSS